MKKKLNQNMLAGVCFLLMLLCAPSYSAHNELWIDAEDLFNIKINMTADEVIEKLGPPLYLEANNSLDEQIITNSLYYNFRTKIYKTNSPYKTAVISEFNMSWGRKTIVQFTFIEDRLVGWEEDKLTLNMASNDKSRGSMLKYVGLLLDIIIAAKVFM